MVVAVPTWREFQMVDWVIENVTTAGSSYENAVVIPRGGPWVVAMVTTPGGSSGSPYVRAWENAQVGDLLEVVSMTDTSITDLESSSIGTGFRQRWNGSKWVQV
jgi:hypothetical protein